MTSLQPLTGGSCTITDNNSSNNLLLLQASPVIPDNNGGGQAMNAANNLHHDNSSHSDSLSSTTHIHGHEQPNNMSHMNGYNQVDYLKQKYSFHM
jgi:hypothetical protein